MSELTMREVKVAIVNRIKEKYPNASFYLDGEVKNYPSFYIRSTNKGRENISLRATGTHRDTFYMRVEYREAIEPTTVTGLNSKLDDVGMALDDLLRYITIKGKQFYPVVTVNETVDNIRIFDFYVIINTTFEKTKQTTMKSVESNQNIKEE